MSSGHNDRVSEQRIAINRHAVTFPSPRASYPVSGFLYLRKAVGNARQVLRQELVDKPRNGTARANSEVKQMQALGYLEIGGRAVTTHDLSKNPFVIAPIFNRVALAPMTSSFRSFILPIE